MAKNNRVLEYTFEPPPWWVALATAKTEPRGVKAGLVKEWNERYKDILMDEPKIGRAVRGDRTQIVVAQRLSKMLRIPPPIFTPSTEEEARALYSEMKLFEDADPHVRDLQAGVADEEKSRQPANLESRDGRQQKQRRVDRAR